MLPAQLVRRNVVKCAAVLAFVSFGWPGGGTWLANTWYFGWAAATGMMWWSLSSMRGSATAEDANRALARRLLMCLTWLSTGLWCCSVVLLGFSRMWSADTPFHVILAMAIPIGLYFPVAIAGLALSLVLYHEPGDWRFRGFRSSTFFCSTIPFVWLLCESNRL